MFLQRQHTTRTDKLERPTDYANDHHYSWPKDIAPLDPGYPLVKDDPWYERHKEAREFMQKNDYSKPPAEDILKAAQARRKDSAAPGSKRPAEQMSGNTPSPPGSPSHRRLTCHPPTVQC